MNSSAPAAVAAATTSSKVASGRPYAMLSRIETENRNGSSSDHADVVAQAREREVADVVAVDPDRAVGHVVEAGEEPRDRRLAGAGPPDERDRLAGSQVQVEVRSARPCRRVAERHVARTATSPRHSTRSTAPGRSTTVGGSSRTS